MKKGIFYNSKKSSCSIYESGLMCFNALKKSNKYFLAYTEDTLYKNNFDFHIFNYHHTVNNWINNSNINNCSGKKYCIVLEIGFENNLLPYTPDIFDKYLILDPTHESDNKFISFPRPLEDFEIKNKEIKNITIGSFGFATDDKKWEEIIIATKKDFDYAIVKINIPRGNYVGRQEISIFNAINNIKKECVGTNIKLELTHNYMNKNELIEWCSNNTINFFPYYRNMPGLAAVTDQAISAERPLLVTNNKTFRHILKYIKPYPEIGIKQAIEENFQGVLKMKKDWSSNSFFEKFEKVLI